jgi:AcrR family transcriptional regulator
MSKRQGDMRERIQQVAIELFTEQGYDKTSLREIAERLEVSKAALYFHYQSKEEILLSIVDGMTGAVDDLIEWGESLPRSSESRGAFFRRIATLFSGQLRPLIRLIQTNSTLMEQINSGNAEEKARSRMRRISALVCDPEAARTDQLRAFFALSVLFTGANPILDTLGLDATPDQLSEAALNVALELIAKR